MVLCQQVKDIYSHVLCYNLLLCFSLCPLLPISLSFLPLFSYLLADLQRVYCIIHHCSLEYSQRVGQLLMATWNGSNSIHRQFLLWGDIFLKCGIMCKRYLFVITSANLPLFSFLPLISLLILFSLQTSGYDHFRERIGTAKTIEGLESVSTDLKSFLLVKFRLHVRDIFVCALM